METNLRNYIDSATSFRTTNPGLSAGTIPSNWGTGATMPVGSSYALSYPETLNAFIMGNGAYFNRTISNVPSIYGYTKPYSAKFGIGCN